MLWAAAALLVILLLVIFGGRMIGNVSTENTDASLVAMEMEEAIYASSFVLPEIDEEASKDEPLPLAVAQEEDIPESLWRFRDMCYRSVSSGDCAAFAMEWLMR